MKTTRTLLFFGVALMLVLSACGGAAPAPAPEEPAPAEPAPAEPEPAPAEPEPAPAEPEPEPAPAEPEPEPAPAESSVQHTMVPGELPEYTGIHLYDHSEINVQGADIGDRFFYNKFERPFTTNQEAYLQDIDIFEVWFYDADPTWYFAEVAMVGRDENGNFSGEYGLEADVDLAGFGAWLILASNPSSTEWTTDGVQVWFDTNGDVGGVLSNQEETVGGDGYETLVFDNGQGDDPDAAWVRISPADPNIIMFAWKKSLFNDDQFMINAWAGSDLDPALFDYNDHFTHAQAGAKNRTYEDFWPIKEVVEMDNTCRLGIGYAPNGKESGVCPVN